MDPIIVALVVLVVLGAFFLGITVSWLAKGYVEDYIENAAYSKSVVHPGMVDENGNMLHDELIYIKPTNPYWNFEDADEED